MLRNKSSQLSHRGPVGQEFERGLPGWFWFGSLMKWHLTRRLDCGWGSAAEVAHSQAGQDDTGYWYLSMGLLQRPPNVTAAFPRVRNPSRRKVEDATCF